MEEHYGRNRSRRSLACAPTGEESKRATTGLLIRPNVAHRTPVDFQTDRQPGR